MKSSRGFLALVAPALLALSAGCLPADTATASVRAPAAERQAIEQPSLKTAIFAGGCFWGVEGVFSHVNGVTSAVSGYHGGSRATARYYAVSRGATAHAEAVRVTYDPALVRYDELLRIFFSVIVDPTQVDRQGPDVGKHYRSALVPLSNEQRDVADAYLVQLREARLWQAPIATRIEAQRRFHPAEAEHQDFAARNPRHPYIRRWDAPKIAALRALYPAMWKARFTTG